MGVEHVCLELSARFTADALRETIAAHLPNERLTRIFAREGTRLDIPLTTFNRIEVEEINGRTGVDLRKRALQPVVRLARALAIDVGALDSPSTFDRLRTVAKTDHPLAAQAKALVPAFTTLVDVHLRDQVQAAERGQTPTDLVDPEALHKSQQNLLKETLKAVQSAQSAARKHYRL